MSDQTKNTSSENELPSFDDLRSESVSDEAPAPDVPAKKSKKGAEDLPSFKEDSDRTDALPSNDDFYIPYSNTASAKNGPFGAEEDLPLPPKHRAAKHTQSTGENEKKEKKSKVEKPSDEQLPSKPKQAIREENKKLKQNKGDKPVKKKEVGVAVKDQVKPKETSDSAKTLFIVSMCLLAPFALIILIVLFLIFALLFSAALLLAGALALGLVALVVAGVVLALTGITYGLIEMVSKSGFAFYAGQYELGLGLAITGITIILSSLLYTGATTLVPFIIKQLGKLIRFLAGKVKAFFKKIYAYATRL